MKKGRDSRSFFRLDKFLQILYSIIATQKNNLSGDTLSKLYLSFYIPLKGLLCSNKAKGVRFGEVRSLRISFFEV